MILNDAQTSGGLLVAVDKNYADEMKDYLVKAGVPAVEIGQIAEKQNNLFIVLR